MLAVRARSWCHLTDFEKFAKTRISSVAMRKNLNRILALQRRRLTSATSNQIYCTRYCAQCAHHRAFPFCSIASNSSFLLLFLHPSHHKFPFTLSRSPAFPPALPLSRSLSLSLLCRHSLPQRHMRLFYPRWTNTLDQRCETTTQKVTPIYIVCI